MSDESRGQLQGWKERLSRRIVHDRFATLGGDVRLSLREGTGIADFGDSTHRNEESASSSSWRAPLAATLTIHDPRCYARILTGGEIGAGESYIDGDWSADDLTTVLRVFVRNIGAARHHGFSGILRNLWYSLRHRLRRNSRQGSARNIAAHYDLSNAFFALFLDETMNYSSAIFPHANCSLRRGSQHKMERLCGKLELHADDHLLEIGSGWGGLAIHAAEQFGCRVTTTTISSAQYAEVQHRVDEAGLASQIQICQTDYRDLQGIYNKIVSVEMIEAVGTEYLDLFFRKCSALLREDGRLVVQAIVMDDRRYARYVQGVDFIRHAIFPGGCLPSLQRMQQAVARETDLRMMHLEDLTPHYAKTLSLWKSRFLGERDQVLAQGFDEQFIRMWEFYLSYCEAAFEERFIQSMQLVWGKPACRWDPIQAFATPSRKEPHSAEVSDFAGIQA